MTVIRRAPPSVAVAEPVSAPPVVPAVEVIPRDLSVATEDDTLDAKQVVSLKSLAVTLAREGTPVKHIAERLKVQDRTVRSWLYQARRAGELGDGEMAERMRFRTDLLALETLEGILEDAAVEPETRLRAALEHLKGKGYYQHHAAINQKVDGQILTELKVSFETNTPDGKPVDIVEGAVVGRPELPKGESDPDDDVDAVEAGQ